MNRSNIVIVDYGMANLRSVQKAFEKIGHQAVVSCQESVITSASHLVLPGVGAFRDAITKLRETGIDELVTSHIDEGLPFLGICLGLQLLFTRSSEDGLTPGLDLLPGEVVRFEDQPGLKIPHMGWNQLSFTEPIAPIFQGLAPASEVYFVHSYFVQPFDQSIIAAEADYPTPFCAAIWKDNILATQFHPEKSQRVGLQILNNFAQLR